jgi:modulator of FtsH protease
MKLTDWTDFLVAAGGAAAALAGLVIVAVSVNIDRILKYKQLPARAAATVGSLVMALLASLVALAPQPRLALGLEVVAFSVPLWLLHAYAGRVSLIADRENHRPKYEALLEIARGQLQALPFFVGGLLFTFDVGAAVYLLLTGVLATFVLSMYETWILLVEILR